jgi:hypothetical protein
LVCFLQFTEECLKVALSYCLDQSLQVKIFGLYLLYGLYFKYPFNPRVKVSEFIAWFHCFLSAEKTVNEGDSLVVVLKPAVQLSEYIQYYHINEAAVGNIHCQVFTGILNIAVTGQH